MKKDLLPKEKEVKFSLEHLLLIHKKSGLLIKDVNNAPEWERREENARVELISGMLTAIKNFTEKVLSTPSKKGELMEIVHSDYVIKIDTGEHTILAAILRYKEKAPENFDSQLKKVHTDLFSKYTSFFQCYDGSQTCDDNLSSDLSCFISSFDLEENGD